MLRAPAAVRIRVGTPNFAWLLLVIDLLAAIADLPFRALKGRRDSTG
jgi:hypothetical protein